MIRVSEAVLPGHPDKLCDFVAESIVQAALAVDPEAYAQIEAGIWCDRLWLSGGYAARGAPLDVELIATEALESIARAVNPEAKLEPWQVTNAVCRYDVEPTRWTRHVNDQAIVIGWAGYDDKVQYLPPEHFLVLEFRDALWEACRGGAIYGKHPTHVDRFGARVARELAIDAVKRGAGECLVRAVYAPNVAAPLDVQVEAEGGDARVQAERLALRGSDVPAGWIFLPNAADIELERIVARG